MSYFRDKYLNQNTTGSSLKGTLNKESSGGYFRQKFNSGGSTPDPLDVVYNVPDYLGGGSYRGTGDLTFDELQEYRVERDVSPDKAYFIRGGSFKDTHEEVDHMVSLFFGGTNRDDNLDAKLNRKSFTQTVQDFFSGKERSAAEYKYRQGGKYDIEKRAMKKFKAGEIGLGAARLAILNYKKPEVANIFLNERSQNKKPGLIEKGVGFFNRTHN